MICLEELSKHFPGQQAPAVDRLSLDVPEGEIVILVGPSGCGKTTTMKMINRIVEPTSGRIVLDGEDVTKGDADHLRRRIGYVIQRIGLFPHMTIAENIATVPKLLGWDRSRIDARIDELLEVVHMPPGQYRDRYPKELSGGQLQRVGVARALSGDPDVMLMDEPFGAIDPIVRERLQNEFLRLQSEVRKTIVFVTHDLDEAIKMGDRIAILQEGSRIAQYDTPERILTAPANDFVAEFIGAGAALKRLNLSRVADIELAPGHVVRADSSAEDAHSAVRLSDDGRVLVLDERDRPRRWVEAADIERAEGMHRDAAALGGDGAGDSDAAGAT
jgi:osmoprotectant transport system ATP-binding protein